MKKIITLVCAAVLMSALSAGFAACDEPKDPPFPEIEWVEVPFAEYSLTGVPGEEFSARWVNLDYDEQGYESKVLVINSDEELKKYVEGDSPTVDFLKKTLVLAYGFNSGGGFGFDVKFRQISDRNYMMTASTWASGSLNMSYWQIAIVVDKLPSESKIKFNGLIVTKQ